MRAKRLNIWVGGVFFTPTMPVDVAEKLVSSLVLGRNFMIGAVLNSLAVEATVCLLPRRLDARTRPAALRYFLRHARDHQRRL